jgi:hypothetical protein
MDPLDAAVLQCLPAERRTSPAIRAGLITCQLPAHARLAGRDGGAAGAVRRDPAAHRSAARPTRAGDVTRQNGAGAGADGELCAER